MPAVPGDREETHRVVREHLAALSEQALAEPAVLVELTERRVAGCGGATALRALLWVLTDLACQRWTLRVGPGGGLEARRPELGRASREEEKARVRAQELVKRDEQLREEPTRRFIKAMEASRLHRGRLVSVLSLMRDGRELATELRSLRDLQPDESLARLRTCIDPYPQLVTDDACSHTGLRLQDIWRYFRHTWSNQYVSTPGRTMAFLVRDRASPCHPVVGIGALGSPIMQIRERDAWIGWHPEVFLEQLSDAPSAEIGRWLISTVDRALSELYLDDLIEDGVMTPRDLREPAPELITTLRGLAASERALHHRLAQAGELKSSSSGRRSRGKAFWRERARTSLYRSKRALAAADMLRSRMLLNRELTPDPTPERVGALLHSAEGRRVVLKVLRKAKADRVGVAMADITVCGALPPYSALLGGKLVALLAASPAMVAAYSSRYEDQESEIASSMAGRPIVRQSRLVLLGTTSLYGAGSSQYNRIRMPSEPMGGASGDRLEYLELGRSEAYGTSQFSAPTVRALTELVSQSSNGQRVNSIFGEGISPKLRKLRDGLGLLGLPSDVLLQHGRQRIVYGVPLIRNLREHLLGLDPEPDYIIPPDETGGTTSAVTGWWLERWVSRRLMSDDVLAQVASHSLARPVRHGARVVLPPVDSAQGSLFGDDD